MQAKSEELEALARRYEGRVGYFARKVDRTYRLGSRWNDELVSAGYWGLFKALENRRPEAHEGELSAYVSQRIAGAVMDQARSCINRTARYEVVSHLSVEDPGGGDERAPHAVDPSANPEESAVRAAQHRLIGEAIRGLQPDQRRILEAYLDGDSLQEIAETEGVAPGTLQVRFQKVKRTLRARAPHLRRMLSEAEVG